MVVANRASEFWDANKLPEEKEKKIWEEICNEFHPKWQAAETKKEKKAVEKAMQKEYLKRCGYPSGKALF